MCKWMWAIEQKSIIWEVFIAMGQFHTFVEVGAGGSNLGGILTSRLNCAVSWDQCPFFSPFGMFCSWFVYTSVMCDLLVGPQCLPVSHTHWVEKHCPRPRWISRENCIFSYSCHYWYHTAVLKRLHCCSRFTFKIALKGYNSYLEVQHLLENYLKE